mmetsp:Transcript_154316/g.287751  ORF Transcript_154316/g.287751 Transcript_154316/m.287751 type:complete len:105 (+) Transcript_154316:144-458(+)
MCVGRQNTKAQNGSQHPCAENNQMFRRHLVELTKESAASSNGPDYEQRFIERHSKNYRAVYQRRVEEDELQWCKCQQTQDHREHVRLQEGLSLKRRMQGRGDLF